MYQRYFFQQLLLTIVVWSSFKAFFHFLKRKQIIKQKKGLHILCYGYSVNVKTMGAQLCYSLCCIVLEVFTWFSNISLMSQDISPQGNSEGCSHFSVLLRWFEKMDYFSFIVVLLRQSALAAALHPRFGIEERNIFSYSFSMKSKWIKTLELKGYSILWNNTDLKSDYMIKLHGSSLQRRVYFSTNTILWYEHTTITC